MKTPHKINLQIKNALDFISLAKPHRVDSELLEQFPHVYTEIEGNLTKAEDILYDLKNTLEDHPEELLR